MNILLIVLLVLLLLSALFQLVSYDSVANDAQLINELGQIRGGMQRYAKRILHGLPADAAESEINRLLGMVGQKVSHLPLGKEIGNLEKTWNAFRDKYGNGTAPATEFLYSSEALWDLTVRMVLAAQRYAEGKLAVFRIISFVMLGAAVISFVLLVFVRRSVRGRLEIRANYDALTGLVARASFEELFEEELESARKHDIPLSILYLDLDHFKRVNDEFGHEMGDQVLKKAASIMRGSVREGDILARLGGEEFVIVLTTADRGTALRIAGKIRTTFHEAEFPHGKPVTVSIGVSSTDLCETAAQLLRSADRAMYEAKRAGRDRVVSSADM